MDAPMIRYRVEPFDLPNVLLMHWPGVFGEFTDVVGDVIDRLECATTLFDQEKLRFFQHLRETVDTGKFGAMQELHLSPGRFRQASDIAKYIDPAAWFDSKLRLALRAELHTRAPLDILDLGTGPAHWPAVAQFYGHRVLGSDLPQRTTGQLERGHLYDALADIYGVRRIPLRISAFTPLPPLERRFGMVTAFLAAFNVDPDQRPWSIEAWNFFLDDLRRNVLTEGGEVFMSLTRGKLTDEVWAYLSKHAAWTDDNYKQIRILDLTPFSV
jgi:hypothetical protein